MPGIEVPLRMRIIAELRYISGHGEGPKQLRAMACPAKLQMLQFGAARESIAEDRRTFL
jgi:hypothetical protein